MHPTGLGNVACERAKPPNRCTYISFVRSELNPLVANRRPRDDFRRRSDGTTCRTVGGHDGWALCLVQRNAAVAGRPAVARVALQRSSQQSNASPVGVRGLLTT